MTRFSGYERWGLVGMKGWEGGELKVATCMRLGFGGK